MHFVNMKTASDLNIVYHQNDAQKAVNAFKSMYEIKTPWQVSWAEGMKDKKKKFGRGRPRGRGRYSSVRDRLKHVRRSRRSRSSSGSRSRSRSRSSSRSASSSSSRSPTPKWETKDEKKYGLFVKKPKDEKSKKS